MPHLDPSAERVLIALVQGLRALDVRFCIIGALVPELLLSQRPEQATLDADAVVFVPDLSTFERVKPGLSGFAPTKYPYRLSHESGGRADILPYSDELAPEGILRLQPDIVFNMTGFGRVADAVVEVTLESGEHIPVVLVPVYVLLKQLISCLIPCSKEKPQLKMLFSGPTNRAPCFPKTTASQHRWL